MNAKLRLGCRIIRNGIEYVSRLSSGIAIYKEAPSPSLIANRHRYTPSELPNNQFRIVSYNLLADFYARTSYSREELFSYCDAWYLSIDYRKPLMIYELLGYKSDIICLQEVDKDTFEHDFNHLFCNLKYDRVFECKGFLPEGLAIFYNKQKFE